MPPLSPPPLPLLPLPSSPTSSTTYIPLPSLKDLSSSPNLPASTSLLPPHALVWVHKSAGKKSGGKKKRMFGKARVVTDPADPKQAGGGTAESRGEEGEGETGGEADRRVTVRYPKGSTFDVRRSLLSRCYCSRSVDPSPIFAPPPSSGLSWTVLPPSCASRPPAPGVLVALCNETDLYRSTCSLHTTSTDRFLEIGSDLGFCCDAVHRSMEGDEPSVVCGGEPVGAGGTGPRVLGVDLSPSSIASSKATYPHLHFSLVDALTPSTRSSLLSLFSSILLGPPTVVAIDINGNRSLPAVLECLTHVLEGWGVGEVELPRLVVVKSREAWKRVCGGGGEREGG